MVDAPFYFFSLLMKTLLAAFHLLGCIHGNLRHRPAGSEPTQHTGQCATCADLLHGGFLDKNRKVGVLY